MFSKKGLIAVEKSATSEEKLMDIVLEHGGEDLNDEGETWEILTGAGVVRRRRCRSAVKACGIATVMSEVAAVASTCTQGSEGTAAGQMVRLLGRWKNLTMYRASLHSNFWT